MCLESLASEGRRSLRQRWFCDALDSLCADARPLVDSVLLCWFVFMGRSNPHCQLKGAVCPWVCRHVQGSGELATAIRYVGGVRAPTCSL